MGIYPQTESFSGSSSWVAGIYDRAMKYSTGLRGCQPQMMRQVYNWLSVAQAVVLPYRCILCGCRAEGRLLDLCAECERELPFNSNACPRCAQPVIEMPDATCGACVRKLPRYTSAYTLFRYSYPVDHMIRAFKYRNDLAQGRVLGSLLARERSIFASTMDMLLPVPLSERRYAERGYNQARELGRWLQRELQVPLRCNVLLRTPHTEEQARLGQRERRRNVRGAFTVMQPVKGARIALLDDVITTGCTVNEAARVLRKAGASEVHVWAVARASLGSL